MIPVTLRVDHEYLDRDVCYTKLYHVHAVPRVGDEVCYSDCTGEVKSVYHDFDVSEIEVTLNRCIFEDMDADQQAAIAASMENEGFEARVVD